MNILKSIDNLFEIKPSLILSNLLTLYILIEFPIISQFHNDKNVISGIKNFVQLNNIGMIDKLENSDLSFDLN